MNNLCPVCGYPDLNDPPYHQGNKPGIGRGSASYEICPSCGFQFGYTDDATHITHEQWRTKWIANGMVWRSSGRKPPLDWNPREQLLNIGSKDLIVVTRNEKREAAGYGQVPGGDEDDDGSDDGDPEPAGAFTAGA